jgi:hypothetical protein
MSDVDRLEMLLKPTCGEVAECISHQKPTLD